MNKDLGYTNYMGVPIRRVEHLPPLPNGVSWVPGGFTEIDEGYGRVDEVEVHWGWIFGFGFFVGGVATLVVWSLL